MRLALAIVGIATLMCSTLLGILPGHAEKRIALVIRNNRYANLQEAAAFHSHPLRSRTTQAIQVGPVDRGSAEKTYHVP
jgi:hypothetical protein